MTEYILRLHAETVIDPQITDPIRHSGYDLITKHDDGTVTIEVIDFTSTGWLDGAVIDLGKGNAYNISDNPDIPIYWGRPLTPEEKEQGTPEVKVLATGDNALEAFNKIKLEAALTNKIDLDYNAFLTREYAILRLNIGQRSIFQDMKMEEYLMDCLEIFMARMEIISMQAVMNRHRS